MSFLVRKNSTGELWCLLSLCIIVGERQCWFLFGNLPLQSSNEIKSHWRALVSSLVRYISTWERWYHAKLTKSFIGSFNKILGFQNDLKKSLRGILDVLVRVQFPLDDFLRNIKRWKKKLTPLEIQRSVELDTFSRCISQKSDASYIFLNFYHRP